MKFVTSSNISPLQFTSAPFDSNIRADCMSPVVAALYSSFPNKKSAK